jgi:hypothetical protein
MSTLSQDAAIAERQMNAIIFYLTTFGHIDGHFDLNERNFVKGYIEKLVAEQVERGAVGASKEHQEALVARYAAHFHSVLETMDKEVQGLFAEAVSQNEHHDAFVHNRLKVRCFEIFESFDRRGQEQLMESLDALLMADGEAHAAEVSFRAELAALLEADLHIELEAGSDTNALNVLPEAARPILGELPEFFGDLEHHYARDKDTMMRQLEADRELVRRATQRMEEAGKSGRGRLAGRQRVTEFVPGEEFVDGNVAVCRPAPDRTYDLTILGDLHGCYSCLKAALVQSGFLWKLAAYEARPDSAVIPKLVLLGDYIDRGMYSLNGVLRAVLTLYLRAPAHVVVLRGNHEYFIEFKGEVYGGVKPSEAIDTLKPHVPAEIFRDYMALFEAMPSMYAFDRTLFVHGGIPRDQSMRERYVDLSSLNDPELRFQMLWSDPSRAAVIPRGLQDQSSRFAFGRLQAAHFLQRLGLNAIVRGHEKTDAGFDAVQSADGIAICTVFSAGGAKNDDLPSNSSYRSVAPMALSLSHSAGRAGLAPWRIDYEAYNDPDANAFFQRPPELRFGG